MALIKLSAILDSLSGKLGGSIISQGANGLYIKQNSFSQQPKTTKQRQQYAKIGQVTQLWRTLTAEQRQTWVDEIPNYPYTNRFGEQAFYTASQLFNKLNLNLQEIGVAVNKDAPDFVAVVNPDFSLSVNQALVLVMSYFDGVLGTTLQIYASSPKNNSIVPKRSTFRLIDTHVVFNAVETFDIQTPYEDVFVPLKNNDYVNVYIKTIVTDTGNVSEESDIVTVQYLTGGPG